MNPSVAARLAQIAAGPGGPEIGAFFDFDGTLIDGFSALYLVKERWKRKQIGLREASELLTFGLMTHPGDSDFVELIENAVGRWKGMAEADIAALWEKIFIRDIAQTVFPESWRLVQAHRRAGHTVVVASSATRWQILPAAREFGIEHVLATPVEIRDALLTGRLAGHPLWNAGKARAVQAFAKAQGVALDQSYGYANGDEDIAFLSALGLPMAINPKPLLAATAASADWPVACLAQRRKLTLEHRLRTTASYAAMAGTFVGGLAANALGLPRGQSRNLVTSVAPELALAAAGIELRIQGEENLWTTRPAVFLFNHQSPLDLVIGVQLMRRDATGVVKAEMGQMLGWGQFARFMDLALVDRADPDKAKAALAPAVEKLKAGLSLGICPEGTRSYSPRLGRFKKGAFHLALQAQVPIVPVVMRNVGDVMHRDSAWMRPGVVEICVLPAVDTTDWTRETLDQHVDEVRQQFVDTLADWPGEAKPKPQPAVRKRRKTTPGANA
ncbi:HAD-IB family hydrolase [Nevskia sp.]|uniref:HAD-IB family hydrolase n=1 Tax=Nevskia sp. TaxID=1929292 RepID=UPI0025EE09D1|nr:HAD-IB family hydrolase [Nevskia sp.]